ncbi:ERMES complex Ca(2+)-binding regulatory GTPase gem1 [Haplosporangium sp. Z 11]|nr:ERMES complex Ca(2+)-binding regulatory GTPase gem1 [Haplosporangium sp. Z 11]
MDQQHVQHVVPEVTIPPEVTPDNVTTHIVDTSTRPEYRDALEMEIRKAHVICIVYAIDDPVTFNRLGGHWLPYIRSLGVNVPVVLVGNKIDLRGDDVSNKCLEDEVVPIMNEFKEVETCVECSAKQPLNVSEVFYFAQKAVLHPTAPLYDSREHVLKPACVDALQRIFNLCDLGKDGVLDDDELNEFQRKCFNAPLPRKELEAVKEVVKEHEPEGVNEVGLTEIGFLFLHTLFIQRGRLETTWTVMRQFGYGDDLTLRESFLCPRIEIPIDCSVELSPKGYQFFTELFQVFDKDKDSALKKSELEALFKTSPGNPWAHTAFPQTTITTELGAVTLQGFLAQWSMTTMLDYQLTLRYLAYLGFEGDTTTAIKVTRPRKIDRRKGKTSLLRGFLDKPFSDQYEPTTRPFAVVNSVEIKGAEKYLVMEEFGTQYEAEVLQNKSRMEKCDLLCFVFDSSDVNSFSYVVNLRKKYHLDHMPSVFVATKSDSDLVLQRTEVQPDVYCRTLGLAAPISISVKSRQMADLFNILTAVAMCPSIATPPGYLDANSSTLRMRRYLTAMGVAGALIAARGPKKHLKRLNAPKHWMLDKLTGTYAPRPTAGPHKLRECLPLVILLRNRLKYALNGKEVQSILMQRLVKVDGKVRTDTTFPAGFMDAITIEKTGENFRLVYDTKGRFTVHRITAEEAKYKLCKVKKVQLGAKGIPFIVTHDGRTLRYPDPLIKVNDTVKLDLETGKFNEFVKFEVGNVAMVTGGRNTGRVGVITHRERHVGGFDIVHIKDVLDRQFATRVSNIFVIGEGNKPWVSLPKNKGVKLTIAEERDRRRAAA